jgi:hypothetical protein
MNQNTRLPIDIAIVRHPKQKVLRLQVHRNGLRDWCLGLCLLKEGLVETFTVIEEEGKGRGTKVKFRVETHPSTRSRITLIAMASEVLMTKSNLDYVLHFFLKYYRDGVAEVDHIDLEGVDTETGDNETYITFHVSEAKGPMTPDEARTRLADWS